MISEVRVISLGKRNQPRPHRLGCCFQGRGSKGPTNSLQSFSSRYPPSEGPKVNHDNLTSAHLGHTWQQPSENPDTQEWKSLDQVEETCSCVARAVQYGQGPRTLSGRPSHSSWLYSSRDSWSETKWTSEAPRPTLQFHRKR